MPKIDVKIFRDVAKNPNVVEIVRRGRKVTATYDGDNLTLEGPNSELPTIPEILGIAYPYELEQVSRPAWYDRNPKSVGKEFDLSVNDSHNWITRLSYIVPTDRKCIVEALSINALRTGAALGNNETTIRWRHTPYGGSDTLVQTINMYGNTVGDLVHWTLGGTITLFAGDEIFLNTTELPNDGGAISFECGFKGTEFDA